MFTADESVKTGIVTLGQSSTHTTNSHTYIQVLADGWLSGGVLGGGGEKDSRGGVDTDGNGIGTLLPHLPLFLLPSISAISRSDGERVQRGRRRGRSGSRRRVCK